MKIQKNENRCLPPHEGGIEHHCPEVYPPMATESLGRLVPEKCPDLLITELWQLQLKG
jgi:hypothetical protein